MSGLNLHNRLGSGLARDGLGLPVQRRLLDPFQPLLLVLGLGLLVVRLGKREVLCDPPELVSLHEREPDDINVTKRLRLRS